MDNNEIELVGGPCGHHGPYTFYKAFKYSKNGSRRIISLCEFFFVKLWCDSDLVCIGELQLLWVDKNSDQMLASLRLYFLPENTPEGRMDHGEDEVLSISEKVVLRLEDLLTWITVDAEWTWGKKAVCSRDVAEPEPPPDPADRLSATADKAAPLRDSALDFNDVDKERKGLDDIDPTRPSVLILSYPRYCRYRALMKRLQGVESKWLRHSLVVALGGFAAPTSNTRVMFCRDTFDYPDLETHELLCNHLAPKLKGRPRGKRKKRSMSPGGSESNESEASVSVVTATSRTRLTTAGGRNGLRCNSTTSPRRSTRSTENVEERDFLNKLHAYMKSHRTPIGRAPSIGYKEIDLYAFFSKVQKLGGYDSCTANRMWKPIFDELGGHHNSTSAATIMRRHYERLLLSYERHIKGEEYKPLPVSERRRLKSKTSSFSDAETTSEGDRSNSGHTTPVPTTSVPQPSTPTTPSTPNEIKEFSIPERTKPEGKISSLRSVRVKPERLRDLSLQRDKLPITTPPTTPTTPTPTTPTPTTPTPTTPTPTTPTSTPNKPNFITITSLPDKNSSNVPVTSAVAPVVEKILPEKSISPLEGKENIPLMNQKTSVVQTRTEEEEEDDDDEPIEIPYKPKSPEIIDLDPEPEPSSLPMSSNSTSMLYDVKKRKLDILKEGGLEVTAITGYPEPVSRDGRPSVIQHSIPSPKGDIGNLSITVTSDSRRMPPPTPVSRSQSPKKAIISNLYGPRPLPGAETKRPPAVDVRIVGNKYPSPTPLPVPQQSTAPKPTVNGSTPPKVMQSRSIYSYSERTVYGNPKDPFMPPPHIPQAPRHLVRSPVRPTGGEVLDLTVRSPQKPIVEIVRVPNLQLSPRIPPAHSPQQQVKPYIKSSPTGVPILDARVGSNLEITLVTGANTKPPPKQPVPKISQMMNNRHPQKRSSTGRFVNSANQNGSYLPPQQQHHNLNPPLNKNGAQLVIPSPHSGGPNGRNQEIRNQEMRNQDMRNQEMRNQEIRNQDMRNQEMRNQDMRNQDMRNQEMRNQEMISNKIEPMKHQSLPQQPMGNHQYMQSAANSLYPGYISQLAAAAASKNAAFLPMLDPLYYSALCSQGLYSPSAAPPMFPPVPTVDQLQFYKDLMAQSARGRYQYSMPPEGSNQINSMAAVGQSDPNLMKK